MGTMQSNDEENMEIEKWTLGRSAKGNNEEFIIPIFTSPARCSETLEQYGETMTATNEILCLSGRDLFEMTRGSVIRLHAGRLGLYQQFTPDEVDEMLACHPLSSSEDQEWD